MIFPIALYILTAIGGFSIFLGIACELSSDNYEFRSGRRIDEDCYGITLSTYKSVFWWRVSAIKEESFYGKDDNWFTLPEHSKVYYEEYLNKVLNNGLRRYLWEEK